MKHISDFGPVEQIPGKSRTKPNMSTPGAVAGIVVASVIGMAIMCCWFTSFNRKNDHVYDLEKNVKRQLPDRHYEARRRYYINQAQVRNLEKERSLGTEVSMAIIHPAYRPARYRNSDDVVLFGPRSRLPTRT